MDFNIITKRPVIDLSNRGYSNANGEKAKSIFKKLFGKQSSDEMTDDEKRLSEEKTNAKYRKKENRKSKRADRKAKRTANKLKKVNGKWVKPISKLKNGKKQNADGTTTTVPKSDQVTDANGNTYDKKDIASAAGIAAAGINKKTLESIPKTTVEDPNGGGSTLGIDVPDSNVVQTETGDFYAAGDTLPATNTPESSGSAESSGEEEKKPMSTTVKVLIGVGVAATIGAIIYVVAKSGKATKVA